jgi:hypothetical protein
VFALAGRAPEAILFEAFLNAKVAKVAQRSQKNSVRKSSATFAPP